MRIPVLAANWKMFKTTRETLAYVRELTKLAKTVAHVEIVIAPPLTSLATAVEAARGTTVGVAVQNFHFEKPGAFTGEVNAEMVKEAGAGYAIIGHSERRRLFGETDQSVNKKLRAALTADLVPIVCVGETLEERESGRMDEVLDRQIRDGLAGATPAEIGALVIAYEPVWAIGTGKNATPAQAGEAHHYIRWRLSEWFSPDAAKACRILYGGSVKPDNIRELSALPDVDGALIGGASLEVASFFKIIQEALEGSKGKP